MHFYSFQLVVATVAEVGLAALRLGVQSPEGLCYFALSAFVRVSSGFQQGHAHSSGPRPRLRATPTADLETPLLPSWVLCAAVLTPLQGLMSQLLEESPKPPRSRRRTRSRPQHPVLLLSFLPVALCSFAGSVKVVSDRTNAHMSPGPATPRRSFTETT